MQTQSEIEALAYAKLGYAECLFKNSRFGSAYYLAGYAIELLLKARVCKTLGIPDFFDLDNSHIVLSIPPKVSVSTYMGTIKGKIAIKMFKSYPMLKKKPYWGNHFWAKGYFVNTVGLNEELIKRYVKYQEGEERKEERDQNDFNQPELF